MVFYLYVLGVFYIRVRVSLCVLFRMGKRARSRRPDQRRSRHVHGDGDVDGGEGGSPPQDDVVGQAVRDIVDRAVRDVMNGTEATKATVEASVPEATSEATSEAEVAEDEPKAARGGDEPKAARGGDEPKAARGGDEPKAVTGGDEPKAVTGGDERAERLGPVIERRRRLATAAASVAPALDAPASVVPEPSYALVDMCLIS